MMSLQKALHTLLEALENDNKEDSRYRAVLNFAQFWHELPDGKINEYQASITHLKEKILSGLEIDLALQRTSPTLQIVDNPTRSLEVQCHIRRVLERYKEDPLFTSEIDNNITRRFSF